MWVSFGLWIPSELWNYILSWCDAEYLVTRLVCRSWLRSNIGYYQCLRMATRALHLQQTTHTTAIDETLASVAQSEKSLSWGRVAIAFLAHQLLLAQLEHLRREGRSKCREAMPDNISSAIRRFVAAGDRFLQAAQNYRRVAFKHRHKASTADFKNLMCAGSLSLAQAVRSLFTKKWLDGEHSKTDMGLAACRQRVALVDVYLDLVPRGYWRLLATAADGLQALKSALCDVLLISSTAELLHAVDSGFIGTVRLAVGIDSAELGLLAAAKTGSVRILCECRRAGARNLNAALAQAAAGGCVDAMRVLNGWLAHDYQNAFLAALRCGQERAKKLCAQWGAGRDSAIRARELEIVLAVASVRRRFPADMTRLVVGAVRLAEGW
jgi:hypothetical protein